MEMKFTSKSSLSQVKRDFSTQWPHLKMEFFTKKHEEFKGIHAKFMITNDDLTIEDVTQKTFDSAEISIVSSMSVWEVENLFETRFGLHAQVFRRSGTVWLQTTVTDNLSLREQEERGLESTRMHETDSEMRDYREMD